MFCVNTQAVKACQSLLNDDVWCVMCVVGIIAGFAYINY